MSGTDLTPHNVGKQLCASLSDPALSRVDPEFKGRISVDSTTPAGPAQKR